MSAVSTGMSKSGAGALIADTAVNLLGEHPNKLLVLFIILVTLLTNAMMNTSCAMLVTPLFIPIVQAFGMNTTAVAIAIIICVAASSPFLTPVGSGTNTLIVRPGNLKFMDFFRPGLGLTVVILIVSMIFIPIFWPL